MIGGCGEDESMQENKKNNKKSECDNRKVQYSSIVMMS
jgi:hypothetical protein